MFKKLSEDQVSAMKKISERVREPLSKNLITALENSTVAFLVDSDQKYTTCLLCVARGKKKELIVGNSKRATYAGMADPYSEKVGQASSFSRAVKHFILGTEGAIVGI